MPAWVEFEDGSAGCVVVPHTEEWFQSVKGWDGFTDPKKYNAWVEQRMVALGKGIPVRISSLPYAASPVLNKVDNPDEASWTLCYSPTTCAGRNSCPKNPCCSN